MRTDQVGRVGGLIPIDARVLEVRRVVLNEKVTEEPACQMTGQIMQGCGRSRAENIPNSPRTSYDSRLDQMWRPIMS